MIILLSNSSQIPLQNLFTLKGFEFQSACMIHVLHDMNETDDVLENDLSTSLKNRTPCKYIRGKYKCNVY